MEVVIDNATLRRHRSCRGAYTDPEWDAERQALVIKDWDATVKRLLSSKEGREKLEWRVSHGLVPMTKIELAAAKKEYGDLK